METETSSLYFQFPEESQSNYGGLMATVVSSVPTKWRAINSMLRAPAEMRKQGLVATDTGFFFRGAFGRRDAHIAIEGDRDRQKEKNKDPDIAALLVYGKKPDFFLFDDAGFNGPQSVADTSMLCQHLLRAGYRGYLSFNEWQDSRHLSWGQVCSMYFKPWKGREAGQSVDADQPARVAIYWGGEEFPTREDVAPIIECCRVLDLKEYTP